MLQENLVIHTEGWDWVQPDPIYLQIDRLLLYPAINFHSRELVCKQTYLWKSEDFTDIKG